MRESIANTFIFNWVIIFIGIIIALLVASISYTKAYKIKDKIIYTIESNQGYDSDVNDEINDFLAEVGYLTNPSGEVCDDDLKATEGHYSPYRYCIYEHSTDKGAYYSVVAYMYFDIPFIGEFLEFPVKGETKVIYNINGN